MISDKSCRTLQKKSKGWAGRVLCLGRCPKKSFFWADFPWSFRKYSQAQGTLVNVNSLRTSTLTVIISLETDPNASSLTPPSKHIVHAHILQMISQGLRGAMDSKQRLHISSIPSAQLWCNERNSRAAPGCPHHWWKPSCADLQTSREWPSQVKCEEGNRRLRSLSKDSGRGFLWTRNDYAGIFLLIKSYQEEYKGQKVKTYLKLCHFGKF